MLGQAVAEAVAVFGSFMDLSTLDGVTVGFDYDDALASIDQGMDGLPPLDRTDTDELQGVAKACRVVRNGVVKTHLVFGAEPQRRLNRKSSILVEAVASSDLSGDRQKCPTSNRSRAVNVVA